MIDKAVRVIGSSCKHYRKLVMLIRISDCLKTCKLNLIPELPESVSSLLEGFVCSSAAYA